MIDGSLIINGAAGEARDAPAGAGPGRRQFAVRVDRPIPRFTASARTADGKDMCRVPVVRETLPNGRTYDTVELGPRAEDDFGPIRVPAGHLWLMGDNRDDSADSRVPEGRGGLGGPVPFENIGGRAEFITFSLDGIDPVWWNPLTWFQAFRSGRAGQLAERAIDGQKPAADPRAARRAARPGGVPRSPGPPRNAARRRCGSAWRWRSPASSSLPSRCC